MADEGVDSLFLTSVAQVTSRGESFNPAFKVFPDKIASYLGFEPMPQNSKFYEFVVANDSESIPYLVKDGSCIAISETSVSATSTMYSSIFIDVNCDKGPNKGGRDRFSLMFGASADIVYPDNMLIRKDNLISTCKNNFKDFSDSGLDDEIVEMLKNSLAPLCSYAIINDGWQMNY